MIPIRIFIVADDPLIRHTLTDILVSQDGFEVVGTASGDFQDSDVELFRPEVIMWDLGWDPGRSIEHLNQIQDISLPLVILIPNEQYLPTLHNPAVQGLLLRDSSPEMLAAAITAAHNGLTILDSHIVPYWRDIRNAGAEQLIENLTQRELDVLELLAEGLTNKNIAKRLGISDHTVKFHVATIMGKLAAQSRTDAVVRATRLGLINL